MIAPELKDEASEQQARRSLPHALVVDDDALVLRSIKRLAAHAGIRVTGVATGGEALKLLEDPFANFDVTVVDVHLPDMLGTAIVERIRTSWPNLPVVLMSGVAGEAARLGHDRGAYDFVTKPLDPPEVFLGALQRALERKRLLEHTIHLERLVSGPEAGPRMLGRAPAFLRALSVIDAVATTDCTVLVFGESGTGKELAARAIHDRGVRAKRPFVAINCGAFTETLVESELFGHVRGAFSGAQADHKGIFEQADRGTIFLDEIGELSAATQVRLLRVLETRQVRRVGADADIAVDVRVIGATHRDLKAAVTAETFREDLYYRLNVVAVHLPALRDRKEDIPLFVDYFLARRAKMSGEPIAKLAPDLLEALMQYDWPGNVRELQNALERCLVLARGRELTLQLLPESIRPSANGAVPSSASLYDSTFIEASAVFQRGYLEHSMRVAEGKISEASRNTGIDRANLRRMLKRHGLLPDR